MSLRLTRLAGALFLTTACVTADQNDNIYAASDDQHNVVKWVKH